MKEFDRAKQKQKTLENMIAHWKGLLDPKDLIDLRVKGGKIAAKFLRDGHIFTTSMDLVPHG